MKKIIILIPLFLFSKFYSQFNTVSYRGKLNSIAVTPLSENRFSGHFIFYHIEGEVIKKRKEAKEAEKRKNSELIEIKEPLKESKVQSADFSKELSPEADDPEEDLPLRNHKKIAEKRLRYKKLDLITADNYDFKEEQVVFMPLQRMIITSNYGNRFHPVDKTEKFHAGIDLCANSDYVFAVLDGTVSDAGYSGGAGNYIKIRHGDFETVYMHLSRTFFSEGDIIYAGDIIALSGNTGKSTAPHLHFAVKENGRYINPIQFLNDLIQTNNALADYNNGK
ncbi:murein DD-endopeptidase MepM/ murein hydrolase activator NlpD [Chryseobacterium defluvii]|uniref:Murein DD-endopeptidase MepM/ murein hydrolase activator NlpD n=1 Tax=Chryseobacterium defluvii TaxID=160396 RepID=A0A840KK62_9FLAO|nr:M23 family metallopeptidase [Chryseobacterium defluvii]MBB4807252.1 murein DD-endopeptidase MepM/ murein hydrolase activator NlpD [Chryseobacterium defluvii]